MTKRVKLVIGGLGFLGLNGAVIPCLENSLNLLRPLDWFNLGGAFKSTREIRGDGQHWGDDSNFLTYSAELELEIQSLKAEGLTLKNKQPLTLGALSMAGEENNDHIHSIKTIFQEITKEGAVDSIQQKTNKEYDCLVDKYLENKKGNTQKLLSNFQKAKNNIDQWTKSGTKESNAQALSQEQRESLLKFYEFFSALNTQKNGFAQELSEISPDTIDISENQASKRIPSISTVKRSLRILQWEKKNNRMNPDMIKKNKWDKLNQNNPFRVFYEDESQFQKDLKSVNSKEQMATQQLARARGERRAWSDWTAKHSGHFDSLERQLAEAKNNSSGPFQLRIGARLLEWMGQLKN